jgi:hypothetical protein
VGHPRSRSRLVGWQARRLIRRSTRARCYAGDAPLLPRARASEAAQRARSQLNTHPPARRAAQGGMAWLMPCIRRDTRVTAPHPILLALPASPRPFALTGSARCRIGCVAARHQQWPSPPGFRPGVVHPRPTPLSCRNVGMTKSRPCARAAHPGSRRLRRLSRSKRLPPCHRLSRPALACPASGEHTRRRAPSRR